MNLLGGGNFEQISKTNLSGIIGSLGVGQTLRNPLTNPFQRNLFRNRQDSFAQSFGGNIIDTDATTAGGLQC